MQPRLKQLFEAEFKVGLIGTQHLTRLTTLLLTHKARLAQLVHYAARAVEAHVELALYERG